MQYNIDPDTGTKYDKKIGRFPWLWQLLFGALYQAYKGMWLHGIINLLLSWTIVVPFIYVIFARDFVFNQMVKDGRIRKPVGDANPFANMVSIHVNSETRKDPVF